jgi:trans-aconitate methyltransferase
MDLDRIAESYLSPDTTFSVDEQLMWILGRRVLPHLDGPRVLEMGVDANVWSAGIIERFGHAHVVDASEQLLRQAEESHGERITTYHSRFERFDADQPFDTILASMVLEHVDDPVAVLSRTRQWAVPGGQVIIVVPNANSLHRQYGVCLGILDETTELSESDHRIGHQRVYTASLLERHVAQAGLRIEARRPTFIKLLSNAQMNGWPRAQLEGLFELGARLPLELGASLLLECRS